MAAAQKAYGTPPFPCPFLNRSPVPSCPHSLNFPPGYGRIPPPSPPSAGSAADVNSDRYDQGVPEKDEDEEEEEKEEEG
ncbi:hypothetical protein AAFF_G00164960 [Aldrovandia affinis]|uniref:Uncharacterized protein n=1 Tax=Aldrovandia affinis TaxID=143900 RepID=A0AAD7RMG3_9TELE|nr:hypothetical protein AAFF_G00164960 [Aldrovandia affinis]